MSAGPCHIGFKVHSEKIIELNDIQNELDKFMWNNPAFRPWVVPPEYKGARSWPWNRSRFPYQLHLLSVDPTVFLAVPQNSDDSRNHCRRTDYQAGCYSGHRFRDEPFQTNSTPRFVAGSFWFAPSLDMATHAIPDGVRHYTIELPNSRIDLNANDGIWGIERYEGAGNRKIDLR